MSERAFSPPLTAGVASLSLWAVLGQAGRLALVWLAFGVVLGALLGKEGGIIGVVSFAIAGAIVTPWLGACLGLLGGQVKETLFGGAAGALIGAVIALLAGTGSVVYGLGVGLIVGGMLGANYSALGFWRRQLRTGVSP
jgi:hypothetical protein